MARLILFLLLFAAFALAIAAAVAAWRVLTTPASRQPAVTEDRMPSAMRNVAYVVLLALLTGVTSGWLGPV